MNAAAVLVNLRRFLLAFSAAILVGTILELSVINHTKEAIQWLPFFLCLLGIVSAIAALVRPGRKVLLGLRASMGLLTLGGLIGVIVHVANNLEFALEVHPDLSTWQRILAALGGANPLMAPAVLAMAAVIALAATYAHPALAVHPEEIAQPSPSRSVVSRGTHS